MRSRSASRPYVAIRQKQPQQFLAHLNLAVSGAEIPEDPSLDRDLPFTVSSNIATPEGKDMFDLANDRLDERIKQNRLSGSYFLVMEPYRPNVSRMASTRLSPKSAVSTINVVPPKSKRCSSRNFALIATAAIPPVVSIAKISSKLGPGCYERVISRLPQRMTPEVRSNRQNVREHISFGAMSRGPGCYSVNEDAIRRRSPSYIFQRPHHCKMNRAILKLIDKECRIGPGSYNASDPSRPRSSFAVITPRDTNKESEFRQDNRPGPGTYSIRDIKKVRTPSVLIDTARAKSAFDVGNDDPGPGSYDLPDTLSSSRHSGIGTFGSASRFAYEGRVYQPIRQILFKKRKEPYKNNYEVALREQGSSQLHVAQGSVEALTSMPETNALHFHEKILPRKTISAKLRQGTEKKRATWRAKLLSRDYTALALDAETEYKPAEEQLKKIQMRWLRLMVLTSRTVWLANCLTLYQRNREQIVKIKTSVVVLQRWYRRVKQMRRQRESNRLEQIYGRIILRRFRQRQFRYINQKKHQAAEIIKVMLVFEKRKLLKGVKTFRFKVLKLQTFWKRHIAQQAAIVAVLQRQWISFEERILNMYADEELKQAMTKAVKTSKSQRRQTASEMREDIVVPRVDPKIRLDILLPIAKSKFRAFVVAYRQWKSNNCTTNDVNPTPWIRIIMPPLMVLEMIKQAQDAAPEEVISRVVKLKLQKFVRRLVQTYSH